MNIEIIKKIKDYFSNNLYKISKPNESLQSFFDGFFYKSLKDSPNYNADNLINNIFCPLKYYELVEEDNIVIVEFLNCTKNQKVYCDFAFYKTDTVLFTHKKFIEETFITVHK